MRVAVIPARGGSKRIPRKNIRPFGGLPMIGHSIRTALHSGLFEHVMVSTDDQEIAQVARDLGASVPFMRPASLADDFATTLDVMQHAVAACRALDIQPQLVCCLYATAPFVLAADLQQGLTALQDTRFQYAFSATGFSFPVQRAIRLTGQGGVEPVWPEKMASRSQDLEPLYHDAGQFYWGRPEAFAGQLPIFAAHSAPILLPGHRVQDIDTEEDWIRAEWMYKAWTASQPAI